MYVKVLTDIKNQLMAIALELQEIKQSSKKQKNSPFFRRIVLFTKNNAEHLGPIPPDTKNPFWDERRFWDERNVQLAILSSALKIAQQCSPSDYYLYYICDFVKEHCSTTLFFPSKYNDFKSELEAALEAGRKIDKIDLSFPVHYKRLEEDHINKAKIEYAQELQKNPALNLIDESISALSAKEMLEEVFHKLKLQVSQELLQAKLRYETREKEREKQIDIMNTQMTTLTEDLCLVLDLIKEVEEHHPEAYFQAASAVAEKMHTQNFSTTAKPSHLANLIPKFSGILPSKRETNEKRPPVITEDVRYSIEL